MARPLNEPLRRRLYAYLVYYIRTYGFAPSQVEIAAAIGVQRGNVWRYLSDLEARGLIRRTEKFIRNIELAA